MTRPNFDLFEDPFLRWPTLDGDTVHVGLRGLLERSPCLASVGAERPQTWFGTLRLLLVLMHWTRPRVSDAEWGALWESGRFPEDWLAEIAVAVKGKLILLAEVSREEALSAVLSRQDPGARALFQSFPPPSGQGGVLSPAALVAEFPAGSNIIHTRPIMGKDVVLCSACAAAALVEQPAFSYQNSGGYFAAPAGNYVTYVVPVADNLFRTLLLGWPLRDTPSNDRPSWEALRDLEEPFGSLAAMTWVPKHIVLVPTEETRTCSGCGARGEHFVDRLVRGKLGDVGRTLVGKTRMWSDPHAVYVEAPPRKKNDKPVSRVSFLPDGLELQPQTWRAVWSNLLRGRCEAVERAAPFFGEVVAVHCVAPRASKAKLRCVEALDLVVPVDPDQRKVLRDELAWFEGLLDRITEAQKPGGGSSAGRIKLSLSTDQLEQPVERLFRQHLVVPLSKGVITEVEAWRREVLRVVAEHIRVESAGDVLKDLRQRQQLELLLTPHGRT